MRFLNDRGCTIPLESSLCRTEFESSGEFRQVVQFGQVDALEILIKQHFGPTQERRQFARI